jgi:hypothetical protein
LEDVLEKYLPKEFYLFMQDFFLILVEEPVKLVKILLLL